MVAEEAMLRTASALLVALLAGCTFDGLGETVGARSESDAERVFAAKAGSANAASLLGIWEGATSVEGALSSTPRFEFRGSYVVAAARCTKDGAAPVVAGGRAPASIAPGMIEIKQAISQTVRVDASAACGVEASAGVLIECDPLVPTTQRAMCFDLSGGSLTLFLASGASAFTKITD